MFQAVSHSVLWLDGLGSAAWLSATRSISNSFDARLGLHFCSVFILKEYSLTSHIVLAINLLIGVHSQILSYCQVLCDIHAPRHDPHGVTVALEAGM